MNYEANGRCTCSNCPGASCTCGCQAQAAPATINYSALSCQCGPNCRCSGGDQGCLCR